MGIKAGNILKNIAAVIIGAGLMFALMRFLAIPTGVPDTNVNLGIAVLSIFAAVFGPIAGFLIGLIGHALVDWTWGGIWWSWVLASAFFGWTVGVFRKIYKIKEGGFGFAAALIFNVVQIAANALAYVFIAKILDMVIYDEPFEKITLQGFTAAGLNAIVVFIIGTILLIGYSKTRIKSKAPAAQAGGGAKGFFKGLSVRLVLGLFLISTLMTMLISELMSIQMVHYERTVTEMTTLHLKAAVMTLANLVSAEELDQFHVEKDMDKPRYYLLREKLIEFANDYNVLYAYYWRDYGNGKFQYIIDNDLDFATQVGLGHIEEYSDPAEFAALEGNVSVTDLGSYSPDWEGLLSAYAPVYDRQGNVYCVAGVDISDDFIFTQRQDARRMTIFRLIIIPVSIIFGVLGMMLYQRKAKQIEEAHVKLQYFSNNLRRAFSTYLSEEVVEEIVSDPARLQLGGTTRNMTVLFTDIKNFTRIAEVLSPEKLVDLLNFYLSTMSDIILEQKGTIDKYQGDAIMSFFGAPIEMEDHALRACTAAIIMKRLENEVNTYVMEKELSPSPLYTRIGINSGEMVVGNMGTSKKMNYTIISNAVNLASRLEGVNKQYGTWILASESTVQETKDRLLTRRLDRIRVVGIDEPVRIYEVLETKSNATGAQTEMVSLFHKALDLFEKRSWKEAEIAFTRILGKYPKDTPSVLYIKRCRQFRERPPLDRWDGIFNITVK